MNKESDKKDLRYPIHPTRFVYRIGYGRKNQNNMANMVQLTDTRLDCISIEIAKDSMSADIVIDITGISMRDFSPTMIYNVITNSKLHEEMVNFSLIKEVVDEVTNRKRKFS